MVEQIDRSFALISLRPGRTPDLAKLGLTLPDMGRFVEAAGLLLARTSPTQLLAMRRGTGSLLPDLAPLSDTASLIDLSDSRICVRLDGAHLPELLPLDPHRLVPGACATTMMAHLSVLVLQHAPNAYEIQCNRSFESSFLRAFEFAHA